MSKNSAVVSDFMREAVREKATREMAVLTQRSDALGGLERARDGLQAVASELTNAAPSVGAIATDASVSAKVKKLRKVVDEAVALATEIGDALGVDQHQDALASAKQDVIDALKSAGLDPSVVLVAPGGEAE